MNNHRALIFPFNNYFTVIFAGTNLIMFTNIENNISFELWDVYPLTFCFDFNSRARLFLESFHTYYI